MSDDELTIVGTSAIGPVTVPRQDRPEVVVGQELATYLSSKHQLRTRIRACTNCQLHAECMGPVPFTSPAQHPSLLVIGEAPGGSEDRRVEPFVGKSGQVLRTKLRKSGFDPETVAYANTVSCRPNVTKVVGGRYSTKDRAPSQDEMDACRGNLFDQLELIGCRFVLLCGGTSLRAFRPDLRLNAHHGRVYVWEGKWVVMATYHPASIFHDARTGHVIEADIERMRLVVKGEIPVEDAVSEWCTICGEVAEVFDPNLAGYCYEHWHDKELKRKPKQRRKVQSAWWASTRDGQRGGKMRPKGSAMPGELFPDVK